MCFLGQQKFLMEPSRQKISNLSPEQLALKKKNDKRALALLKALAPFQTAPSADLSAYPTLAKHLNSASANRPKAEGTYQLPEISK